MTPTRPTTPPRRPRSSSSSPTSRSTRASLPLIAQPGDTVIYTITVTNNGPNATDDTITNDPAPIQANIIGHTTDNGTFDEPTRTWTIPHLDPDETATLTVTIRLSSVAIGNYHNIVAIQQSRVPDPDPDNNTATADLFVPAADIAVSKTVDDPTPTVGDNVTFTVGVSNLGPDDASDVSVADVLPAGLTYCQQHRYPGHLQPHHRHLGHRSPRTSRPSRHQRTGAAAHHRAHHPDSDDHEHRHLRPVELVPLRPRPHQQHRRCRRPRSSPKLPASRSSALAPRTAG